MQREISNQSTLYQEPTLETRIKESNNHTEHQ